MNINHTLNWSSYVGSDTTAANMSTTGGATLSVVNVQSADDVGLQMSWSGSSPAGTTSFAASNNYDPSSNSGSGATWTTIPSTAFAATSGYSPAGSDSDCLVTISLKDVCRCRWLKVTYTPASGSGTLRCHMHGKG